MSRSTFGSSCQPVSAGASTAPARPIASSAARNARSTPASSSSQYQRSSTPTRSPARRAGSTDRGSRPSSTSKPSTQSATVRAIGPQWSSVSVFGWIPAVSTSPNVGFRPTMPQADAGTRTEPPVSVPGARSTSPAASATADPEEEPPGIRDSSCGLRTGGRPGVWPIIPQASWCMASLPTTVAPASRWRRTLVASTVQCSCRNGAPESRSIPATEKQSLNATTRPASGPSTVAGCTSTCQNAPRWAWRSIRSSRSSILCNVHAPVSASTALRSLLAERRAETEAVLSLVRRITSSLDVDEILGEAVRLFAQLTGSAGALIYLLDPDAERLRVRAGTEGYEEWVGVYSLEVGAGLTGWTALNRTPAIVRDNARDDPRYLLVPELHDERFESALTYLLIPPSDRLVGVVTLHTEAPHEFTEDDLTLVAPIAALVAASVETAQLYAERRRQLDAVRTLASAVDDLGSAAARRRALHGLAESARALLGADAVLLATRDAKGRFGVGAVAGTWRRAERVADAAVLEPLAGRVRLLTQARHGEVLAGVADAATGVAAPVRAGGELHGLLLAAGRQTATPALLDVLEAIAATAGQVILNGR